jgi:hypothetical protein
MSRARTVFLYNIKVIKITSTTQISTTVMQIANGSPDVPKNNKKPNTKIRYIDIKILKMQNKTVPIRFKVLVVWRSILSLYPRFK